MKEMERDREREKYTYFQNHKNIDCLLEAA